MLQSGGLDTFTQVREKEREKRERRKRTIERRFCLMFSCWFNITGILKRKEKRKKELFLRSHYFFDSRILKFCYIFNAPLW